MRVVEIFQELTKIPRCSGTYEPFIQFIQKFADQHNYVTGVDKAKNILCYKKDGKREICLQSHYDMVCLEEGKVPELFEEDGYLQAKNSTLGADNGIGCAYMLALMEEQIQAEYLFTSDEEIGLIGANNIEFELKASKMLNLDSEEEGQICIGCAGGIDIFGINNKGEYLKNIENKKLYEITLDHLDGGHSGVDIDKNIPNALKLIVQSIKECGADLLDIYGGERINSIPKSAHAIIVSHNPPKPTHLNMKIIQVDTKTQHYKKLDPNIIDFLYTFAQGVRGYNKELEVVQSSINLATIENSIEGLKISLSGRSMDNEELKTLTNETVEALKIFGFEVATNGKYPAWKPSCSVFTQEVLKVYQEIIPDATLNAVHAGLECAIFKAKYPNIDVCSIGPNIYFPHSHRERCEINSVLKLYEIVKRIVKNL